MMALVKGAVRRERGDGSGQHSPEPHRHRVPLGLVMLAQGWITHPQLQMALESQRANGHGRIGDWLISECGLQEEQITRGLGVQWGCPVLSTEGFLPEEMALVIPRQLVEELNVVPLRIAGGRLLYLGFEDRLDAAMGLAVERMSGIKTQNGLVESTQFRMARSRLLQCEAVPERREALDDEDAMAARIAAILEQKQPIAARLVRVHQYYWLRIWLETGTKGRSGDVPRSAEDMHDYLFTLGESS
jgi:hypothetical protein